jgi:hypothetical protein
MLLPTEEHPETSVPYTIEDTVEELFFEVAQIEQILSVWETKKKCHLARTAGCREIVCSEETRVCID